MTAPSVVAQSGVGASPATTRLVWAMLVVFGVVMVYLAYRGYRVSQTEDDMEGFTLAKGYLGPVSLGVAFAATWSSAVVFLGLPGFSYASGVSALTWHTFMFWAPGIISIIVVAKKFRAFGEEAGSLSLPEWIGDRYDSDAVTVLFAFVLLFNIMYVAAQFTGLALLFDALINIQFEVGAVIALAVVVGYVAFGGTYTDVVTDFIQGVLMMIIGLVIFVMVFVFFGGPFQLIGEMQTASANFGSVFNTDFPIFGSPVDVLAIPILGLILAFQPQLSNKFLSLRNERDVKLFIISAMAAQFCFYLMLWAGPMAYVLNPELSTPDLAVPLVLIELLPAVLVAFFGVALISATLSTADGVIVSIGTAIGNDAYRNIVAERNEDGSVPEKVERRSVYITRATIGLVGIAALVVTLQKPALLTVMANIGVFGFIAGSAAPVIFGLFWKDGTATGALAAGIAGPATMGGWALELWLQSLTVYTAGALSFFIGTGAFIVVSLLTEAPETEAMRMGPEVEDVEAD